MRKSIAVDHLLENAVAVALGLEKPYPHAPRKLAATRPARRHHHAIAAPRHERARAAA